ncbi:MAG: DNA polymerase I [Bacteroidales bacterium]|nr:DNA polymerase I [Bacteroidales bacterium]
MRKKLFLLDAYALIYRSYYAFIRNPRVNSKGFNTSAIFGFVNTLEEVLRKENPSHIAVAFDPPGPTFRHEEYEEYKAQREKTPEDIKLSVPIIKDIIRAYNIDILEVDGYEADDVVGTIAKRVNKDEFDVYMMTSDKDYAQLVDKHIFMYIPRTGRKDVQILDGKKVMEKYKLSSPTQMIDLLGLMGDASDNIPGCPGVGPKRAETLLTEFGSVENILENSDKLKGALKKNVEENKEQIILSKHLVTIKTDVPLDVDIDNFDRKPMNEEVMRTIFEELEFRTLLNRVLDIEPEAKIATVNQQGSLFDNINDEDATVDMLPKDFTDINSEDSDYTLVDTTEGIKELNTKLCKQQSVAFDTETTGVDPLASEIVGISFSYKEGQAFYVPLSHIKEEATERLNLLKPFLEDESIEKIGQNIKYDILMVRNYDVNVQGPLFDTMIAHYLINPETRHNMDYLADTYLKYKTVPIEELIGPKGKNQGNMRDVDVATASKYACEDADITLRLKHLLEKEIKENKLDKLFYEIECPLIYVLADMEWTGARLDLDELKVLSKDLTEDLKGLESEIIEMAGMEYNVNSPKQTGEVLFDHMKITDKAKKTKTGQYSTSEGELEKLRNKHPIIAKILEYRGLRKLLNTYIDAFPLLINPRSNKIHTSFNQTVAATGRLSSTNPNLQNIPIRTERGRAMRKVFIPDDGNTFLSADYSQIELRIMAHLSKDEQMTEAFNNDLDIHSATAAKIYKVALEEVTSDMRDKAKTANFGIIYGISVFGLSQRLDIPRSEAKQLIDGYFETYPDVAKYMESIKEKARGDGYVETVLGRKRFLPDINSRNGIVRGYAERNAINAPIQGSAADIIKVAMIRIFRRFEEEQLKSKMILQVHDELNFDVPMDELEVAKKIVMEEMENAYELSVPLKTDCGNGENWLEAH